MALENSGFRTGRVYMPGLDILVNLRPNHFFRDDGPRADTELHRKEIFEEFSFIYRPMPKRFNGICLRVKSMGDIGALIYVASQLDDANQLIIYGHESAHALHTLGYHSELVRCAQDVGINVNTLDNFFNNECIANLGKLIARKKLGLEVRESQLKALICDASLSR